jgi:hypothetical protein
VPGRPGTAGRGSGPSTARLSCRARHGTIKWAVLRAGPSSTTHLAIYTLGMTILPASSNIRRISDLSGTGSGTKFDSLVLHLPDPILLRVGYGFDFLPAGTRRISENSDFRFSTYQYAS